MKACLVLVGMAVTSLVAGVSAQPTRAPLSLFLNGGGSVSPFTNGEPLEVGQAYLMVAIPEAGYIFSSWQPANVFVFITSTINPDGSTNPPVVSVVKSLIPTFTNEPSLNFTMQPVTVISDLPNSKITESTGWQANFEPVLLGIELSETKVILTWTELSYALQAAPTPFGPFTDVPGATSPYTNGISGPAQYFRLDSKLTRGNSGKQSS